jgi:hypothetical protein
MGVNVRLADVFGETGILLREGFLEFGEDPLFVL